VRIRLDPFLVALALAALAGALLPVSGPLLRFVQVLSLAVIAGLFFLYGARLSTAEVIAGAAQWRVHLAILGVTFGLFPLSGLVIERIAWWSGPLAAGVLLLCLMPSTVQSSIAFTSIAGGDRAVAVVSASVSNLLGVVLTPLLVALLMGGDASVTADSILRIVGLLLAPFLLAQVIRPFRLGQFVARHDRGLRRYDRASILVVVYGAFASGTSHGVWSRVDWLDAGILVIVVIALLAVVLAVIWWGSRPFGRPQRVAMLFCGSNKSLASGLPIATVLLPGDDVALMILPLMAYHQIQLIVCTMLANRLRRSQDGSGEV